MSEAAVSIEEVRELIAAHLRGGAAAAVLEPQTPLAELGIESLQLVDVVTTLEERHRFEFDADRIYALKTLGELVELANESLGATTAEG